MGREKSENRIFDLGWVDAADDLGWESVKAELAVWMEEPEFWKRIRFYARSVQPILKDLEPLRRVLQETPIEKWPAGEDSEKLENLRQSLNRILWTYGGIIKLLRKASNEEESGKA